MLYKALKSVRKFHRMSVNEFAQEIGVSPSYISEIENNKKRIHNDILDAYSRVFDMPISSFYLIAESEQGDRPTLNAKIRRKVSKIIHWIAAD
ncbi:MAG: helix-turn-helix transcriptional regulator [Rhodobacteraceae bacterium]|nr:helix-turn-helix transcriptional regulator [Paracoccaceae bacterium]MCY4195316.1 helix-turn-helix transcriptional regulator [Paracoccaceae bacterium]